MKFRSLTYGLTSASCFRALLCFGALGLLVACSSPAEKIAPADDTSTTADTAGDASDTGADTADSTSGEVTEDTAPDAADTAPDTAPDTVTDTGEPPATCDEQLGLLPSTDCGCGGQLICRDQAAAPQCVGALPENACGGCGGIAVEIGAGCGFCGDGVWTCDAANPDAPTCVGETPQNSCGGCTTLPSLEGDSCSADGFFLCVTEEELVCVGPGQNACGGFAALGEALGGPCGECGAGRFVCDGTDTVRCEEAAEPRNDCGGCGTLPNRVGDACGDCDGTWACDPSNEDGLLCSQTRNVCGSCGSPGAGALGEACTGGRLVCGVDGQLSCESNDRNLCGGTTALTAEPGTGCGSCGGVNICAGLERVVCIGSAPVNGCGGCGFLPGFPGTFCGVDHTWECNADGTMACAQTSSSVVVNNTVGGTTAVAQGQVTVPAGAVPEPVRITIRVRNGMLIPGYELTSPVLEFGPAGTEFATPIEVQIISDDAPASDMVWSNRATEGGGYSEVPSATVEGDALVGDVSHFSIGFTGIPLAATELCDDLLDNDSDGLTDCDDSDCTRVPSCAPVAVEDCSNGIDDDRDLLVDCDDSDCSEGRECNEPPVELCDDGVDNDGDAMTDCADVDCVRDPACRGLPLEVCGDGLDNDENGLTDCADAACAGDAACTEADAGSDVEPDALTDTGTALLCGGIACVGAEVCKTTPAGDMCLVPCVTQVDCAAGSICTAWGCVNDADAGTDATDVTDTGTITDTGTRAEICDDGLDNNGNGWVDCDDGACSVACGGSAACDDPVDREAFAALSSGTLFETCSSLGNQAAISDCFATAGFGTGCASCLAVFVTCGGSSACTAAFNSCSGITLLPPEICDNRLDDNANGLVDCADPACSGAPLCGGTGPTESCSNGSDDNGNGLVDCADPDCASVAICEETNCTDDLDNNGNGFVDCADSGCGSNAACFEGACGDYLDNDGDDLADCNDPDCVGTAACQEICNDGIDNDGDALVDCFDVACRGSALCPQQRCAGLGTYTYDAGNGVYYQGFGTPMTPCAPREGCSLISPPIEVAVAGALVPTYEGVCAPRLADGASCTAEPADGYCSGSSYGGAGCIGGLCRTERNYCDAGYAVGYRTTFLGSYIAYCVPAAQVVATGQPCGDLSATLCSGSNDRCVSLDDLRETNEDGVCARFVSSPGECPAGTLFQNESVAGGRRSGLCLPVVGDGAACGVAQRCDETLGLVCGSGGTCRAAVQAEACDSPSPLTAYTSAEGPGFFAVDRLDGLTAADESLNCSGTVGPEKVYFYTATAPVELEVQAGSFDRNGPMISWYARRSDCGDIFAEAACGNASLEASRGTLQVAAGETIYIIVDSEARWAGGDGVAAEFFITVTEAPIAQAGESCLAAACAAGLNCTLAKVCATPACGDGQVDAGEECDDGNSAAGDGCAACTIESYTEVEPNGEVTSANFVGGARRVYGSSTYDYDYFCMPVGPRGGKVSFRPVRVDGLCELSFSTLGYGSCEGEPVVMTVDGPDYCFYVFSTRGAYAFDVMANPNEELSEHAACGITRVTGAACGDIGGNAAVCRETDPRRHLGTCEVTSCGDGYLDKAAGEACDDGNLTASDGCSAACALEDYVEVEPNNGTLTARNIAGYRQVSGTISGTTDYDYFKVTLARRSHLEFDAVAPAFPVNSSGLGIQLLSPTAAVLFAGAIDDSSSRSGARGGYELNGTGYGYVYREQGLAFLEPGTYTIRVSAASTITGDYTLFIREFATSVVTSGSACAPSDYKPCLDGLACSVLSETCQTPVCGNGDVTVGEQCDDGNTTGGDGCSAVCLVEPLAAASIPTGTAPSAPFDGGLVYPFAGGSTARAIAVVGPWYGSNRYVTLHLDAPTRIRALNVYGALTRNRIWKLDAPSSYSTAGTQVVAIQVTSIAYPGWFSALTPALASDVNCDTATADGFCTSPGTGTDCADCGARYGSTPGTAYGFDTHLAPGDYLVEFTNYNYSLPSWLFLGESPSERRTFR